MNDSHLEMGRRGRGAASTSCGDGDCARTFRLLEVVGTAAVAVGYGATASADTLELGDRSGLSKQAVAQRARCARLQALSGYRPKFSVTATGGFNYFRELNKFINQQAFPNFPIYTSVGEDLGIRQFGATATQTLFNGFQTANRTRQAESQSRARARRCASPSSKFFSTPLLPT